MVSLSFGQPCCFKVTVTQNVPAPGQFMLAAAAAQPSDFVEVPTFEGIGLMKCTARQVSANPQAK